MDTLPLVAPEQVGLSAARLDRVRKWMNGWVDSGRLAGMVIGVFFEAGQLLGCETQQRGDTLATREYARFALDHPNESWYHLRSVNSYIVQDIPLTEKLTGFIERYAQGISPTYWFLPTELDLIRHRMKDYGHLALIELPLMLVGIGVCIRRIVAALLRTCDQHRLGGVEPQPDEWTRCRFGCRFDRVSICASRAHGVDDGAVAVPEDQSGELRQRHVDARGYLRRVAC
jgi:hypothetical protein